MALTNLTTLFGINPSNNLPLSNSAKINGGGNFTAFNYSAAGYQDKFTTNTLNVETDKATILKFAKSNPRIMALLKEYNIPLQFNPDAI